MLPTDWKEPILERVLVRLDSLVQGIESCVANERVVYIVREVTDDIETNEVFNVFVIQLEPGHDVLLVVPGNLYSLHRVRQS